MTASVLELPAAHEPTRGAIIHLLRVRKGGSDSLFSKALDCLEAVGSDEPNGRDITWLRHSGYVKWDQRSGFDALTPLGLHVVERRAKEIARAYGLHHISHRSAGKRTNMGPSVSCTCGWSDYASRTNTNRLYRSAEQHIALVTAGNYKAPRPVGEFLNEVAPLQFDFGSGSRTPPGDVMPDRGAVLQDGCTPQAAPVSLEAHDGRH